MQYREDVITLQNPHGLPPASVAKATDKSAAETEKSKAVAKPAAVAQVAAKQKNVPCECKAKSRR